MIIMVLLLIAVLGYSGCVNLLFIVFDERVPAEISVALFESSMAAAQFFTALAPTIAMLKNPLPMLIVIGFGLGTLYMTTIIKDIHKPVAMDCLDENY